MYRLFLIVPLVFAACHGAKDATQPAAPAEPVTAIVGATVVHPERVGAEAEVADQTIVVRGDRIVAVGPEATTKVPAGATIVDGHGKWAIAGLVDSHVHFFQSGDPYTRPDAGDLTRWVPYAAEVARNKARLPATFEVWLASGVTSVVDVGGPMWNFEVRDAARKSDRAPRVEVAGPLISMIADEPLELDDPPIIEVDDVEQARALAKRELAHHPDFLKIWFIHNAKHDIDDEDAMVAAVADEAHAAGIRLAVHATELDLAKRALRNGADVLVHSVFDVPVDDELIGLLRKHHAMLIPTLGVFDGYRYVLFEQWQPTDAERRLGDPEILATMNDLKRLPQDQLPPRLIEAIEAHKPIEHQQVAMDNLVALTKAGIPIAMGTDAGNIGTLHGPGVFREMGLMAQAGLSPAQILVDATIGGARMLGMDRQLGTIEPGKLADLVLLEKDPLTDVEHLSHAWRVVRAGHVYDPAVLMADVTRTAHPIQPKLEVPPTAPAESSSTQP